MAGAAMARQRLCRSSRACQGSGDSDGGIQAACYALQRELRHELFEALDRAAPADARMDRIAAGAQAVVLRAGDRNCRRNRAPGNPRRTAARTRAPVAEHEVDLLGPGQQRAPDGRRPGCTWGPSSRSIRCRGMQRTRLDRHAQDHFVLDDQARDRLLDDARLHARTGRAAAARSPRMSPESRLPAPSCARLRSQALNIQ